MEQAPSGSSTLLQRSQFQNNNNNLQQQPQRHISPLPAARTIYREGGARKLAHSSVMRGSTYQKLSTPSPPPQRPSHQQAASGLRRPKSSSNAASNNFRYQTYKRLIRKHPWRSDQQHAAGSSSSSHRSSHRRGRGGKRPTSQSQPFWRRGRSGIPADESMSTCPRIVEGDEEEEEEESTERISNTGGVRRSPKRAAAYAKQVKGSDPFVICDLSLGLGSEELAMHNRRNALVAVPEHAKTDLEDAVPFDEKTPPRRGNRSPKPRRSRSPKPGTRSPNRSPPPRRTRSPTRPTGSSRSPKRSPKRPSQQQRLQQPEVINLVDVEEPASRLLLSPVGSGSQHSVDLVSLGEKHSLDLNDSCDVSLGWKSHSHDDDDDDTAEKKSKKEEEEEDGSITSREEDDDDDNVNVVAGSAVSTTLLVQSTPSSLLVLPNQSQQSDDERSREDLLLLEHSATPEKAPDIVTTTPEARTQGIFRTNEKDVPVVVEKQQGGNCG